MCDLFTNNTLVRYTFRFGIGKFYLCHNHLPRARVDKRILKYVLKVDTKLIICREIAIKVSKWKKMARVGENSWRAYVKEMTET